MKGKTCLMIVTGLFIFLSYGLAQEKPTSDEAKRFLNYYYYGQGKGVILVDAKVCEGIIKEGELKNECENEVTTDKLAKSKNYYLWMVFTVPEGDEASDITVQFNHNGITKLAKELSVSGSIRYRTWKMFNLKNSGEWEIKVLHPRTEGTEELGKLTIRVLE